MEAAKFLGTLWKGKPPEDYLLVWEKGNDSKISHWTKNIDEAVDIVKRRCAGADVYIGCGTAPTEYTSYQRCKAENIIGIGGIWLDADIVDPIHKKKNLPETYEDILKLVEFFAVKPTMAINSGHGYQFWWCFDQYWHFDSPKDRAEAAELTHDFLRVMRDCAATYGWTVDMTFDLSRVMRIPGTKNHKGDPIRDVFIVDFTDQRYPKSFLYDRIEECRGNLSMQKRELRGAEKDAIKPLPVKCEKYVLSPDADVKHGKFQALCALEPRFNQSWEYKRKDFKDQSPSSYDLSLATYAMGAGWTWQETVDLLIACRRYHGADLKLREDYYNRTLSKASKDASQQRAKETINDVNMNINGVERMTSKEKTETIKNSLTELLGVPITRIVKLLVDPPEYRLETPTGHIHLGGVKNLIGQSPLREKIADVTGRLITPVKPAEWNGIAQALLDACEHEKVSEDSTNKGLVTNWLISYLTHHEPLYDPDNAHTGKRPFYKGKNLLIFGPELRQHLSMYCRESISARNMGILLKEYGMRPSTMSFKTESGKYVSRSLWSLSIEDPIANQYLNPNLLNEANKFYASVQPRETEEVC